MSQTSVVMVMNMKGGVGKTTISTHLAWGLAWHYDAKVLLVDYDPQCSASLALMEPAQYFKLKDADRTIGGILTPSAKPLDPFTRISAPRTSAAFDLTPYATPVRSWQYKTSPPVSAGCFHIVPGDLDLIRLALTPMTQETEVRLLTRWGQLLDDARDKYDIIVIDCHPAGSFFTKSAITKSNFVLIPVTTDSYAALGLNLMRTFIDSWSKQGGASHYAVLFNDPHKRWDDKLEASIRSNARFSSHCMVSTFRHSAHFRMAAETKKFAPETGKPHRKSAGATIASVTDELVRRLLSSNLIDVAKWQKKR